MGLCYRHPRAGLKRTLRTKRKHEQERGRITIKREWTVQSRACFANLVNAALKEAGVERRVDPRSYKEIGINEKPVPRIDPKAYQREKQGIPTAAGDQTVAAQWDRELKRISALYDTIVFDNAVVDRFNAAAARFKKTLHTNTAEVERTFGEWAKAIVEKRGALAERAAVLFNVAKIRSRLTPPLDHRTKPEIAATRATIDDLQKQELAPLNQIYRGALVKEKKALTALAKLERAYSSTPQATAEPLTAAPPSQNAIKKGLTPPTPNLGAQPQPQAQPKAEPINIPPSPGAAPAAKSKTATPTIAPTPAPQAKAAQRPTYGSIPGAGTFIPKFKPAPKPDLGLDDAALAQMEAERARQFQADWERRHEAWAAPIRKVIADTTLQVISAPDMGAALDELFAQHNAAVAQTAAFDAEIVEIDKGLRDNLRNGKAAYNDVGVSDASRSFLNERLSLIAKDKDPTIAAAAKAALEKTTLPAQPTAAQQPEAAAPAQQPASTIPTPQPTSAAEPLAPSSQANAPPSATKTVPVTSSEPKPAGAKPVELQPAPAPPQPTVLSPNAYRRRTRVLTPEERNALTKTHLTSRPKPKDDTPETMPAHAQRRRPALHDEPPPDDAQSIAPPSAAPSSPPSPSPAAPRAPHPETAPAAAAPPATPAPIPPTPARAPEPEPSRQAVTTPVKPIEPETAPAPIGQPAEPPPVGPTVEIAALPEAKKRKKKKVSELSAEERRRTFFARQRTRGSHER